MSLDCSKKIQPVKVWLCMPHYRAAIKQMKAEGAEKVLIALEKLNFQIDREISDDCDSSESEDNERYDLLMGHQVVYKDFIKEQKKRIGLKC